MRDAVWIGDRYEVLSRVGSGGMADVYKAKDHKLNRFVAIKILKKEYREDAMFVKKFQSEAQAAAGLMHPNIVNVYDVGEESGIYYMVMELVEGITLKDYIGKKGMLSAKEVISIAIQVSNGIEAAHMNNIVHRDIKPQNIIISKEGKVKVTDFGIAKAASSNTISTNALGSVHYSSPEQARGGFSDFKSDIYSLGITMYEMATGQVPFDGDTPVSIAIKHLQEEITPPSEYVEDIPYSLEQIILKCTQKNSDRRYQNINALREDLKHSLVDPEGDFVVIGSPKMTDETVMFSPEDMGRIQREAKRGVVRDEDGFEDDYEDDDYDDYDEDDYGEDSYSGKSKKKDSDVNPKMAKIMKILTIVAIVIIIFVMVVIVGKATGLIKFGPSTKTEEIKDKDKKVKVPNIVGKTEAEARKILKNEKYDLGLTLASEEESTEYEKGQIIRQTPEKGKEVNKKTTVTVVISSGKVGEKKAVPDVTGKSEDKAYQQLTDEGFTNVRREYQPSSEYENGDVIRTNPAAGQEIAADAEIILYVSKGEEKPTVPNVIGKSQNDAKSALESLGLYVSVEEDYHDSVAAGKVFYQSKKEGTRVAEGSTVIIRVSKGKKEVKVTVPSIRQGDSNTYAKNQIESKGLRYKEVLQDNNQEKGTVLSCPDSGKEVAPGTTITVYVSKGPQTPAEPPAEEQQ